MFLLDNFLVSLCMKDLWSLLIFSGICCIIFRGVTCMSFGLYSGVAKSWQILLVYVMLIPSFGILALALIYLKESPVYLANKGRFNDLRYVINRVSIINQTP